MSRTGEVGKIPLGAYPTPSWAVHRLLEAVAGIKPRGHWLEPAWGTGAIVKAVNDWGGWANWPGGAQIKWSGYELNSNPHESDALGDVIRDQDFLAMSGWQFAGQFDVAITNPDFPLAFGYMQKMRRIAHASFLLTRLNILEAGKTSGRLDWLRNDEPDVYVLPDRPVFAHKLQCHKTCKGVMIAFDAPTPESIDCPCRSAALIESGWRSVPLYRKASTDATGYCWLGWSGEPRTEGRLIHLAETPKAERLDRIIP